MEREKGYYWIDDGCGKFEIGEYIGNNEWIFTGCSLKFTEDKEWIVNEERLEKPTTSESGLNLCNVSSSFWKKEAKRGVVTVVIGAVLLILYFVFKNYC